MEGVGQCVVEKESYAVQAGDLVLVPKDAPHSIRNTHDSQNMVCILAESPVACEHVPVAGEVEPS